MQNKNEKKRATFLLLFLIINETIISLKTMKTKKINESSNKTPY
jgi:hypothetical protein